MSPSARTALFAIIVFSSVCRYAQGQVKAQGLPARSTPADYQAQAKAGPLTVAAEFMGHSVVTPEGTLITDDYVVVEAALFGPPDSHANLAFQDFSLRINGKKTPTPSQAPLLVFHSLKDPDLEPTAAEKKQKTTTINANGQGNNDSTPAPVHIPIEVRRGWEQRVAKASWPEGDRPLPQDGLIFFPYRGKTDKIQSIELIYTGHEGTATLDLHP